MKKRKRKIKGIKDNKIVLPVLLLGIGLLFLLLDLFSMDGSLRYFIHWVADPVIVGSEDTGESISSYFTILIDIPKAQKELNDLRSKVFNYESQIGYTSILEEENQSLREELNLGNKEHIYIEAKVLGKVQDNTIRVNAGENQGVEVGDTISLGYNFIGIVMDTTEDISTVRLPYSKSSTLEVWIASQNDKEKLLSRAVVKGSEEEYMIIENVSKKAGIEKGDYVIVKDEKVVDNLVLGKISELNLDPASTSINGRVLPIVDFELLVSVFICTEW